MEEPKPYIDEVVNFIREERRPLPTTHPVRFAVLEGLDGAGKTTITSLVLAQLRRRGLSPILVNPSHPVFHDPLLVEILDNDGVNVLRSGRAAEHGFHFFETFAMLDAFRYCLIRDASIVSVREPNQLVVADSWCYKRMVKYLILARYYEARTAEDWRRAYKRIVTMYLPALSEQLGFLVDISPDLALQRKQGNYGIWEAWDLTGRGGSPDENFLVFQSEIRQWMKQLARALGWVVIERDPGKPTADNQVAAEVIGSHLNELVARGKG